jgi:hypothetical protein
VFVFLLRCGVVEREGKRFTGTIKQNINKSGFLFYFFFFVYFILSSLTAVSKDRG